MRMILGFLVCLIPASLLAQDYTSDAFGLLASGVESLRTNWAGAQGDGRIDPGPVERVLIVLGPKSLVAGKDPAHAVVLAFDRFGNAVADGTRSQIRIEAEEIDTVTRAGIADHLFLPTPEARTIAVGASIGDRQSARATIRVIPDIGSLSPGLETLPGTVAPESFFEVTSAEIRDRFGNLAEDGTAAAVLLTHAAGETSYGTALVSDGQANALFLSRDVAGQAEARMVLGVTASVAARVTFDRPIAPGPPDLGIEDLGSIAAVRMTVGPFVPTLGYTLIDGAKVHLEVTARGDIRQEASGWVRDGYFVTVVPVASSDDIETVTVTTALGTSTLAPGTGAGGFQEVME